MIQNNCHVKIFRNSNSNTILEWVHKGKGNLVCNYNIQETYVDKDES